MRTRRTWITRAVLVVMLLLALTTSVFASNPTDEPGSKMIECPDCGKKIALFGESRSEEAAARHGLDLLAEMPIDPKLASLVDAGKIEDFEGDWMSSVADAVEKLPNKVFEQ